MMLRVRKKKIKKQKLKRFKIKKVSERMGNYLEASHLCKSSMRWERQDSTTSQRPFPTKKPQVCKSFEQFRKSFLV